MKTKHPYPNTSAVYIANAAPKLPKDRRWVRYVLAGLGGFVALAIGVLLLLQHLMQPPAEFPLKTEFTIAEGETTIAITETLHEEGFIRSPLLMYLVLVVLFEPRDIKASTYIFSQPLTMIELAKRLMIGDYGNDLVRFVHYEGESRTLLAERAADVLDNFSIEEFMTITTDKEGMLFPDTYLLPVTYTAEELATLLYDTYQARIEPLRPAIANLSLTEYEVITLASILEREANSRESKKLVSGILQKRLEIDMPLQVDASMEYVLDKPLSELTADDLKTESPYNTYLNNGLPPTPIGNPGLTAIEAVLEPTSSSYLFYLTGNDGIFYYANTYEGHLRNISLYLRN